jgi:hypothetical protein
VLRVESPACANDSCYKNVLDPANATQFGAPVCCLGLGAQCRDDADCCKGNFGIGGAASMDFRPRHCIDDLPAGAKICKRLALTGEECQIRDDCLLQGDLCTNGICTSTAVVHLRKGDVCIPGDTQRVCDVDPNTQQPLTRTNCTPENQGYRCIPSVIGGGGCCNNGKVDREFCGSFPEQCCNWECTNVGFDEDHCGVCGRDCDALYQDPWVAACHTPPTCSDGSCVLGDVCAAPATTCVPEGEHECLLGAGVCCYVPASPPLFGFASTTGAYEGLEVRTSCFSDAGCSDGKVCAKECGDSGAASLYGTSCDEAGICTTP